MAQLMLQAGLRVGEVAALEVADITMNDRSGSVRRHPSAADQLAAANPTHNIACNTATVQFYGVGPSDPLCAGPPWPAANCG